MSHASSGPSRARWGELVDDPADFELLRARLVDAGATDGTLTDFGAVRAVWFSTRTAWAARS